ncbi:D-alanine--D-alanine ligase [Coriobacterium glomerans PW2]|uniref:D-alanine--D-alanine ligase n=1 Tax=Coriobacterium glomerans (strain ATCC 49209 / DSM 20642 / JCM 10262 / PW2) TaxID=700015 RepID=F2N8Z6_CORGP|nr:ATP-grasp domain-containing protein [Coriobacterium glomerans]AEB07596.1 D-alanine--D-alanine ligase [Coriobacterium glomerans PW2]
MKVAVIMGGTSLEREFSLKSGHRIARELEAKDHIVLPLDATSELTCALRSGRPDVALIAVHGLGGEDGAIQGLLEFLRIPYVGSTSESCRASWNKVDLPRAFNSYLLAHPDRLEDASASRSAHERGCSSEHPADQLDAVFSRVGSDCARDMLPNNPLIPTPKTFCLTEVAFRSMGAAAALDLVCDRLGYPVAVKPACGGSAMGVSRVGCQEALGEAIMGALSFDDKVIIQEWLEGVELSVAICCGQDGAARSLTPVEIAPKETFFTTAARLDPSAVDYFAPVREESLVANGHGRSADDLDSLIARTALDAFCALGCRDLARVDMMLSDGVAYVIDVKVAPGMSENSLLPMAVAASGFDLGDIFDGLVRRAAVRGA